MKKIMFNDRFGLTEAVLAGRKTMTRRIIPLIEIDWAGRGRVTPPVSGYENGCLWMDCRQFLPDSGKFDYVAPRKYQPAYKVGEVVAVAQRYQDIPMDVLMQRRTDGMTDRWPFESLLRQSHGWGNKQGVVASLMPHRIRITGIKMERLQDISDEDCLREGVTRKASPLDGGWNYRVKGLPPKSKRNGSVTNFATSADGTVAIFATPRAAFAALIDRISGKGTWNSNPWVFAYEFELVE